MKIMIMGAGAVGGYFGARLAKAGEDVTFIARGAHLDAMRQNGLVVESTAGDFTIPVKATDDPAEVGEVDMILFLVKLYDTDAGIEAIRPAVGDNTVVASFQNGITAREALTDAFGARRTAGGTAYIAADVKEPGTIRHYSPFARLVFGPYEGTNRAPLEAFAAAMEGAGASYEYVEDISRRVWEKFVFLSAFSAITSLTRLPIGPILADPNAKALFEDALAEAFAVAKAHEPSVAPDTVEERLKFIAKANPNMRSSMLDDLTRGKRLEVPFLSGRLVALGEAAGIATPVHRAAFAALSPWRDGPPQIE
ncbi:2-dehydropantoate 2-reductase [Acuticoccus sp. M5D2P5]|uniref:ketopantoate reductase family protein n=1 Tax=Acuticoccus kalidii TaxID=2910977 RepID=UPI001F26CC03|nr:2-dehydropantoate 2-reductase [Acuticoccus kalidii]MCF3936320.1 2-dehydropantoate 2-reductase [Acuticoccus kalidii]